MLKCISSDRYTMRTRLMWNSQTTLKPCLKVFDSVMKYCKRCKVLSRRHFPKGDSQVRDSFPSGNFPTVQFPKRKLSKGQVRPSEAPQDAMGGRALRLGAECRGQNNMRAERCGWDRLGKLSLRKFLIWEVATLENNLGKLPLEKNPLRKYLTSCKLSIRRRFNNLYDTYTSSTLSPCSFTNFDFKHIRRKANLSV